jgi:hypothetical protein
VLSSGRLADDMKKPAHHKPGMLTPSPDHPGLERDSKGDPVPMAKRLPEDRRRAKKANRKKGARSAKA